MAILGKLIKTGINLTQLLQSDDPLAIDSQKKQLIQLLTNAKDTAFGKYYGFSEIVESSNAYEAFVREVPIFDYNKMHSEWWIKQELYPDITWRGKPEFFALSSGTTGKTSKRIPITGDFLHSMKQVGISLVKSIPNFDFPEELFQSEVLMLGSSADLQKNPKGFLEGEISGINTGNFPGWYDLFYRPGKEIASISDWDERLEAIIKAAPDWNIGAIAGIPSWILLMIKAIVKKYSLQSIHDLWPNFSIYASGGVAFDTYRNDFEALCGKPVTFMDTYLASEGFFAYTARPSTMDMVLATDHGYFYEFIPFDERGVDSTGAILENPEISDLENVVVDQEYVLVISSCAGAWRYIIGDVIKFTSIKPYELKITGRTKFYLNVVGSQLSEEKMDAAILDVSAKLRVSVNEYAVAAVKSSNGDYSHQWVLVSDDNIDDLKFSDLLDASLKESNKNYEVARAKALKGITVKSISKNVYYRYLDETKKVGGQIKTPKVMKEEKMTEFMKSINS